ncbi:hypothetical protein Ptc2401_00839 [Prosthecochloris sp. CIB 2401]|nr:hypothetical protein Ptc2401_00839 [Prosthecochloris sp. CIB 2401]
MDRFGIVTVSLMVALNVLYQVAAFVVGVPAHPFRHADAVNNAYRQLHPELCLGCGLASYDWSDMGLTDAYDPVTDALLVALVHFQLLPVQFVNHQQVAIQAFRQDRQRDRCGQAADVLQVPPEITQLLA